MLTRIAALAALSLAAAAFAAPAGATSFSYPSFPASACGTTLSCVGDTTTPGISSGYALQVTTATTGQAGAAYYSSGAVPLGTGDTFSTTFQFRFTNTGGIDPADGITFVVAQSSTGLGVSGEGLGIQNVNNSVAVEFDTYDNPGIDTNDNHVAVLENGQLDDLDSNTPYGQGGCTGGSSSYTPHCMSNGDIWTATVGYDGTTQLLNVTIQDGSDPVENIITNYSIDLASEIGASSAFVGFTGSTGSGYETQDVLNWAFTNTTYVPPPVGGVPEPATLSVVGVGMVALGLARRRRR